ncbi:MAG: 2'-5' RNA ligase family protein [Vicinamibacterales bacterium]
MGGGAQALSTRPAPAPASPPGAATGRLVTPDVVPEAIRTRVAVREAVPTVLEAVPVGETQDRDTVAVPSTEERPQAEYTTAAEAPASVPRDTPETAETDLFGNPLPAEPSVADLARGGFAVNPENPQPGDYAILTPDRILADPERFQFKQQANREGVTTEDRIPGPWNENRAGLLLVWRDPQNGQTYVINGHHRLEAGKRLGAERFAVRYIDAATADDALLEGALTNIAEKRGTPVDVAKVVRTAGLSADSLRDAGVNPESALARDGLALAKLSDPIFVRVATGEIPVGHGAVIGAADLSPEGQDAVLKLWERQKEKNRTLTPAQLAALVEDVAGSAEVRKAASDGQRNIFADVLGEERVENTAVERAVLKDFVRQELAKDKRLFGFVAKGARPEELARGGNVIDVAASKRIASAAVEVAETFDSLASYAGPVADALNAAASAIVGGEKVHAVRARLLEAVRAAVETELRGPARPGQARPAAAPAPRAGPRHRSGGGTEPASRAPQSEAGPAADVADEPPRQYSSTQVNLPPDVGGRLQALAGTIPDTDLAADGRESDPHITVQYGIESDDVEPLRQALAGLGPVTVRFGKTSLFENEDADVVKVDIDSPDLRRVREAIRAVVDAPGDTHPTYVPHATIAYVKPGRGRAYAGRTDLQGQTATIDRIVFSTRDRQTLEIPLAGPAAETAPQTGSPRVATAEALAEALQVPAEQGVALRALFEATLMERADDVQIVRGGEPGAAALEQDPRLRDQLRAQEVAGLRDSLRPARTADEARSAASRFIGQRLINVETDVAATVSTASIGHYLSERDVRVSRASGAPATVHMLAVANLDTLYHVATRADVVIPRDPEHARWRHIFDAPLPHGDEVYRVRMVVLEYRDPREGTRIYSVQIREITPTSSKGREPGGLTARHPARRRDLAGDTVKPPSGVSPIFDQLVRLVKGEATEASILYQSDRLPTGEEQPRLPGEVGEVREEERPTPREALPESEFRLTAPPVKARRPRQDVLFQLDGEPLFELIEDTDVNASGESAASAEAISRLWGMQARGETFALRTRGGQVRPLIGPDAVDVTPGPNQDFGILRADGSFQVLDRGERRLYQTALAQRQGQGIKGSVEFLQADAQALIRAFETADVSTAVHELAHIARRWLLNRDVPADRRRGVTDADIATAERWAGAVDGVWSREAEEKFARGFERFLRDRPAPADSPMRALFTKMAAWLTDIYQSVTGSAIDVEISPEIQAVFERLVTRQTRVEAEQRVTEGRKQKAEGSSPAPPRRAPSGNATVESDKTDFPVETGTLPRRSRTLFDEDDTGALAPNGPRAVTTTRAVEFPELVALARELAQVPQVVKRFRGDRRLGDFTGIGRGRIRLLGSLFARTTTLAIDAPVGTKVVNTKTQQQYTVTGHDGEGHAIVEPIAGGPSFTVTPDDILKGVLRQDVSEENLQQLAKTLAHEIGHLVDWLPDKTLKRGNLLGRLQSLHEFLAQTFTAQGGEVIAHADVRRELIAVSKAWRGDFQEKGGSSYDKYRQRGRELYADALSALLNNPGWLQREAPTFYAQFFDHLDAKPAVRSAYFGLQELLSGTREELIERRRAGVREMFEEGDAKAIEIERLRQRERQLSAKDLWYRFRVQHVDKNTPLLDRIRALQARGVHLPEDQDPRYLLEERSYLGGKLKAFVETHLQPVYESLNAAGIDWHTFGEALFYDRIIAGDRSEVANPRGLTVEAAQELRETLVAGLSAAQRRTLKQATTRWRTAVTQVAEEAYQAGLYRPEMYAQMQANPAYATYRVIDYLERDVTSTVHRQVGTLKDIQNVADATALKMLVTLRAAEYNRMKVATFAFLTEHFPDEIAQAEHRWNGKALVPVEARDPKTQVLVPYKEQGRVRGKYVDPYVADMLNNTTVGHAWAVVTALRWVNSRLFRPVFTTYNPGFQTFNVARDFLRFWKNMPGMTFRRAVRRYVEGVPLARARAFGLGPAPTAAQRQGYADLIAAEHAKILSITFNDLMAGRDPEDTQIEDILAKSGLGQYQTKADRPRVLRPLMALLDGIKATGDFIETLPKAAAMYEFTDGRRAIADLTPAERSFIRRKVGSPDFLAGGTFKPITNEILLFSNAITQAIRADVEVARDPQTRSGFWAKTVSVNIVPKLALFAALYLIPAGGDDEDEGWATLRRALEGISEYDLTNYLPIPLGTDADGRTVYVRIPQDDLGRLVGGLTWKLLQGLRGDAEATQTAYQVLSYMSGQAPSVTPSVTTAREVVQYATGQNVYDAFRSRFLFTEDELAADDWRKVSKFLGYEFQQIGGGLIWRFVPGETRPREVSTPQRVLELPLVSNVVGRWVKVSDFGRTEKLRATRQAVARDEARVRLSERALVNDALRRYQALAPPRQTAAEQRRLAREIVRELYPDARPAKRAEELRDVLRKIRMGAIRGQADPLTDAILGSTSTAQKVAIVRRAQQEMAPPAFAAWYRRAQRTGVVSTEVATEVRRAQREARRE